MNDVARSPLFDIFQRPAAVREDLLVDGFHLASRPQRGHQTWNAVHDQTRLTLALAQVAIQPGILERDRRLRSQQLRNRDSSRRKDARSEPVLEVEDSNELGLVRDGQTEN